MLSFGTCVGLLVAAFCRAASFGDGEVGE